MKRKTDKAKKARKLEDLRPRRLTAADAKTVKGGTGNTKWGDITLKRGV